MRYLAMLALLFLTACGGAEDCPDVLARNTMWSEWNCSCGKRWVRLHLAVDTCEAARALCTELCR